MLKKILKCTECGTVNDSDALYCKKCGIGDSVKPIKNEEGTKSRLDRILREYEAEFGPEKLCDTPISIRYCDTYVTNTNPTFTKGGVLDV